MLALVPTTTPSLNFVGDVAHSLLRDGTSAFAASALATTLLHPLDTLKTRIQSQRYRVGANGAVVRTRPRRELLTDLHAHAAHAPAHPHTRQQQRERAQLQPLFADLYTGLGSNILKEAPDAAVYLALYQCLSQALLADEFGWWASHATLALLVAGAAGDAAGSVLRLPAEVACKRLQTGVAAGGDHPSELLQSRRHRRRDNVLGVVLGRATAVDGEPKRAKLRPRPAGRPRRRRLRGRLLASAQERRQQQRLDARLVVGDELSDEGRMEPIVQRALQPIGAEGARRVAERAAQRAQRVLRPLVRAVEQRALGLTQRGAIEGDDLRHRRVGDERLQVLQHHQLEVLVEFNRRDVQLGEARADRGWQLLLPKVSARVHGRKDSKVRVRHNLLHNISPLLCQRQRA